MKITEIRFTPKTKQPRDLVYSEHSSRSRSLHIFFQDQSIGQYKFLLKAYREIINSYLSSEYLETPITFLKSLAIRLDALYLDEGMTLNDIQGMGFFLILRERHRFYLLTSMEEHIHVRRNGHYYDLSALDVDGLERLVVLKENTQEELFPQRLQDVFSLLRITALEDTVLEFVLGCSIGEREAIIEAVKDAGPNKHQAAMEVCLEFLSRKVLFLRFTGFMAMSGILEGQDTVNIKHRASLGRVHSAVILATAVLVLLAGAAWMSGIFRSKIPKTAQMIASSEPHNLATFPPSDPSPGEDMSVTASEEKKPINLTLNQVWKNKYSKAVTSSPAIAQRRVFWGCRDGKLRAANSESGTSLWTYSASDGIGTSPAVSGHLVIAADYQGNVFAINAETGTRVWQCKLPAKVVSSPCIKDDKVLIGCYDHFAYCISIDNGRIVWKRKTKGRLWGSAVAADQQFFIPSYDGDLYALSTGTGEVLWKYNIGGNLMSSPAVSGEAVIAGGPDGRVHAINRKSGKLLWVFRTGGPVKSSILASNGSVFFGSHDRHLYCLDATNGSLLWKFKTAGFVFSRPCMVNGMVFFGSYDSNFYCLDAESGALLDQFATGGKIYSSPASLENQVFFGNNAGEFFCLVYSDEETS